MRLTKRFLIRSFVVIIMVMFCLPLLIYYMDTGEDAGEEILRRRANKHNERAKDLDKLEVRYTKKRKEDYKAKIMLEALKKKDSGNVDSQPPQLNQPQIQVEVDPEGPDLGPKSYGPKAVFTKGQLGNYEPPVVKQTGPGEGGEAVYTSMEEKEKSDKAIREYGFNMVASDKIAMNRTIPDTRLEECKYWQYPEVLPSASVIIVFHNEGFSTLMRTVHSVIDQSPPQLLHEVVMVDDFSDKPHLAAHLDEYIKQFNGKVKLYRNKERLGLIMTRTMGARYSTGDVIIFLDAHCECGPNWLPPLLARIAYDRTILAVPIIDGIDWNTFRYRPVYGHGEHFRGIFEWGFLYKESHVPSDVLAKRAQNSEPYPAPTHAGGLFAIDRRYFFELGAYDPGLQIWGGENFELSFKIWQCGGSIEWVPCSHVGHVYRNHMPYGFGKLATAKVPVILLNYMRVVEVWLDPEHKEYFYAREPTIKGYPIGDISAQLEFKRVHKCRSFDWFLKNVATEVLEKYPGPSPNIGWGEIRVRTPGDTKSSGVCWDTKSQQPNGGPIGIYYCHHYGGNQMFRLNAEGQMGVGERCIEPNSWNSVIRMAFCPVQPTGPWTYDKESGWIRDKKSKRCATAEMSNLELSLKDCEEGNANQRFDIREIKTW